MSLRESYMLKVLRVGEPELSVRVNAPEIAQKYWNLVIRKQPWFDENKEHLVVLLLSTQLSVEGYCLVSIGSLNESIAHPREIFRAAVASGSFAIVLMHNHPSGDPQPSKSDVLLTNRLLGAAEILQIRLMDHVIMGRRNLKPLPRSACCGGRRAREAHAVCRRGYYSFTEAGVI